MGDKAAASITGDAATDQALAALTRVVFQIARKSRAVPAIHPANPPTTQPLPGDGDGDAGKDSNG